MEWLTIRPFALLLFTLMVVLLATPEVLALSIPVVCLAGIPFGLLLSRVWESRDRPYWQRSWLPLRGRWLCLAVCLLACLPPLWFAARVLEALR